MNSQPASPSSATGWMAKNHVAANLLMLVFLIGGFISLQNIKQEVFPEIALDVVTISVAYPGAGPEEIETGILQSIEAEVRGIEGVKRVTSLAKEGNARVSAELFDFIDQQKTLQDIKNAIDRITTFPEDAERPNVALQVRKRVAVSLMVYGDQTPAVLRHYAEGVKHDLIAQTGITLVELASPRPLEIAIEIAEKRLRELNLTLPEVAARIQQEAQEIPAGGLKTESGEILIRINERRESSLDFADIPIVSNRDGALLRLRDIASLRDGFSDNDQETYFNGQPAVKINVYSVANESPVSVAKIAKHYITHNSPTDQHLQLSIFEDRSQIYADRINLLVKNALMGLLLVLVVLGIFLDAKLAFWVMLGLPVSILGSFIFLQFTGASLNMVSLFAFIITIGIVVDDAVIVGEAVYEQRQQGVSMLQAAMFGAKEMAMPVTFAVLTNIIAFLPMVFVPGAMGDIFGQIPAVVMSVLAVSLIESLFILPAHLSHSSTHGRFWRILNIPQKHFSRWLEHVIQHHFQHAIRVAIEYRYTTVATCIAILIMSIGLLQGGIIGFSFLPKVDRDLVSAKATLAYGVPIAESRKILHTLVESAILNAEKNGGQAILKGVYATIGENGSGSHKVSVIVSLVPSDQRHISGTAFAQQWRHNTPELLGLESITFSGRSTFGGRGTPIQIEIMHPDQARQQTIAQAVAAQLKTYKGVLEINDGIELGKRQLNLTLKPEAKALGITAADLSNQLRGAFHGIEALRQQRGENEIKVMVRLTAAERSTRKTFDQMVVRTPQGNYVPLHYLAHVEASYAYTEIERTQGQRVVVVTADVNESQANVNAILTALKNETLPKMVQQDSALTFSFEGEERARQDSLSFLKFAFLVALLSIYGLLAIPFKSYLQPIAVMLSIPFGIIGAIGGHLLLGYDLSIISLIGIIGLSGIVINDALVLIVTLNRLRASHETAIEAAIHASIRRFRPILLTSLTTFIGLLPMLFETSMQARFLIPMAISISFGVLFSTIIILALVPSIYMVLEDFKQLFLPTDANPPNSPLPKPVDPLLTPPH